MVVPMVFLSILAIATGWWNAGGGFARFMGEEEVEAYGFFGVLTHSLPLFSLSLALLGILLAWAMYGKKVISPEKIGRAFKPLYTLFSRKYYFDELYENIIVKISLVGGLFAGLQNIDTYGIDGTVNTVAGGAYIDGKGIRRLHTGQLQLYGLVTGIGLLAIILVVYLFG
jgi:NADH-quinone oxidoreductase subunit L